MKPFNSFRFTVLSSLVVILELYGQVHAEDIYITKGKYTPFTKRPEGFVRVDERESCIQGSPGLRYWKVGDPSIIRIEDNEGNFVGTQTGFYKKELLEVVPTNQRNATVKWYESTPFVQSETIGGEPVYLMTGYIYHPSTICLRRYWKKSTHLYLKYRTGFFYGYRTVDRSTDSNMKWKGWDRNPCVPAMGDHYRSTLPGVDDPTCKGWYTPFLLYTHGKNVGFGWNFPGNFTTTNFEKPTRVQFSGVIDPMPNCIMQSFDENNGYNSQHVYVIDGRPQDIPCP